MRQREAGTDTQRGRDRERERERDILRYTKKETERGGRRET